MTRGNKRKHNATPNKRFDVGTSIHNRFDIEVVDSTSGKVKRKAFAENVICNQLWTRLFSGYMWNSYIHYGDGSGTPSASDTSLFSHLGWVASTIHNLNYDYDNNVFVCTKKAVLDETVAVGKTLTEVGIAYSGTSTNLVTHAMLKDMNGNPVSLEKSDTDIFNIYATVFVHFTLPSKYVRILGSHRFNNDWWTGGLLAFFSGLTSNPTFSVPLMLGTVPHSGGGYKTVTPTYDVNNRTITYTASRIGASEFNVGGLRSFMLRIYDSGGGSGGAADVIIDVEPDDGWFGGTHISGEAIGTGDGTTVDFATRFGYASNAKIYVDGVETNATVDYINHALHQQKTSYTGLQQPLFSYFRILQSPEVGLAYYSPYSRKASPVVYYQDEYSIGQQFDYPTIFENTLYRTHGVSHFASYAITIKASNDLITWVTLFDGTTNTSSNYEVFNIPEEYQNYRYWSIQHHLRNGIVGSYQKPTMIYANADLATLTNNIHFSEPPAAGAVITADYDAVCVAKDENHVFDFSVVFSFNEYIET